MDSFLNQPVRPLTIDFDLQAGTLHPAGPVLTRRMSDLEGLFADRNAWRRAVDSGDPVVYSVQSSPVPEADRELPQSVTTIEPGTTAGEFWMTRGHQHPNAQGEIYLGISGRGGLLMYDGTETFWLDMTPGIIGYIPPGWAHRSVNVGNSPYKFLAVYPGNAGHDYGWVLKHGMGKRVYAAESGPNLRPYGAPDGPVRLP